MDTEIVVSDKKDEKSTIERIQKNRAHILIERYGQGVCQKSYSCTDIHKTTLKIITSSLNLPVAITSRFSSNKASSWGIPFTCLWINLEIISSIQSNHRDIILFFQFEWVIITLQLQLRLSLLFQFLFLHKIIKFLYIINPALPTFDLGQFFSSGSSKSQ